MSNQTETPPTDTKRVNGSPPEPTLDDRLQQCIADYAQVHTQAKLVPSPQGLVANVDPLNTDIQVAITIAHVTTLLDLLFATGVVNSDDFKKRMIVGISNSVHDLKKQQSKPRIVVPGR